MTRPKEKNECLRQLWNLKLPWWTPLDLSIPRAHKAGLASSSPCWKPAIIAKPLSGGERRRTEIARALASDPKFILLDEPFAGIDPIAVEDIQYIVARLKTKNIGILITDHNVQETLSITDRAYLMFEGSILKAGTAEELAADEMVRKVYLGKHFELRRKVIEL